MKRDLLHFTVISSSLARSISDFAIKISTQVTQSIKDRNLEN